MLFAEDERNCVAGEHYRATGNRIFTEKDSQRDQKLVLIGQEGW
jgi:hypothetical protein